MLASSPHGLPGVDQRGGLADHEVGGAQLGVGLGEREGDALVLADRAVEHDALVGVGDGPAQRHPADAERLGGDQDALGVEPVEQVLEAAALLADAVASGTRTSS